ncbi:hypothetical protein SAMN05444395_103279 [Flavobacterium fryxellicola]|uniref:GTP-binding protein n=1 Tax=Flavobacterium fryxellicola TaxID=249352 RepID=A0A167X0Q6_9FLAO|nr:hypothetical protein [Flavobacterium fryxellicola]OAB27918.1 hypothetical protein FBFR_08620 [Flavobacterium fryxellicola]SHN65727.1 hypothetical protein SAMN05444395_103279 [Flavobacterium fryxellicola]
MDIDNEISLRLRFHKDIAENADIVRQKFANYTQIKSNDYFVKVRGYHIWLNLKGPKKKYYSPHLHIELEPTSTAETHIRGLYGPDPNLWTFFIFLHFITAGLFLIFGGIAYSNSILKQDTTFDFIVMILMVIVWFLLYFIAKQIRQNGNNQMEYLDDLFQEIVNSK